MRDQVVLLARAVPRMLGRVLVGGFFGGLLGFFVGALATTVSYLMGHSGRGWTAFALAAVSTLAFVIGGSYIGALRGCAAALGRAIEQLGLVPLLWNQVKPWVQRYAGAVRGGARHAEARAMALSGFRQHSDSGGAAGDLAERAELFVAGMLHGALAGGMLRGMLGDGDVPWDDVERQGLARANEAVADLVARLFHGPAMFAMLVTVAVALAPHLIYAVTMG